MKISAFWKIIRPLNTGITFFVVFLLILALNPAILLSTALLAAVSAGLTAAAGNVINDICDIDIDKINRPERILPSEQLSRTAREFFVWHSLPGHILPRLMYPARHFP